MAHPGKFNVQSSHQYLSLPEYETPKGQGCHHAGDDNEDQNVLTPLTGHPDIIMVSVIVSFGDPSPVPERCQ